MKSIEIEIDGISPLLMHSFPMVPVEAMEKKPPEDQARLALYERDGKPYVPAIALQRALIGGATYSKGKGRGSLAKNVAACVLVSPEYLYLNSQPWEIDARPVVVPATKGRIIRYRPRFDHWNLSFQIDFDENLLTYEQLNRVLIDTGQRVGLLDFRPERRGPFGRFIVIKFSKC